MNERQLLERHRLLEHVEHDSEQLKSVFPAYSKSRYVPGEGPVETMQAPWAFIVGEAPGAQEDARKRPFIGPAGQVLRQLMKLADLPINCCWLTNAVKFRPPGNRKPLPTEIKAFRPLLITEWRAMGCPRLVIPLGNTALEAITGERRSITEAVEGGPFKVRGPVVYPMFHPSVGLRGSTQVKERLEVDWEKLGEWLKQ